LCKWHLVTLFFRFNPPMHFSTIAGWCVRVEKKEELLLDEINVYILNMPCVVDILSNKSINIEMSCHFCEKPCASKSSKSTLDKE
jgi:hypothetical protein